MSMIASKAENTQVSFQKDDFMEIINYKNWVRETNRSSVYRTDSSKLWKSATKENLNFLKNKSRSFIKKILLNKHNY